MHTSLNGGKNWELGHLFYFFLKKNYIHRNILRLWKKINIFAILFILKGLRRHHWYRRHTWQTVLRQLRMLSGKNVARANGDHDKHGKFTYKQPEGIWQQHLRQHVDASCLMNAGCMHQWQGQCQGAKINSSFYVRMFWKVDCWKLWRQFHISAWWCTGLLFAADCWITCSCVKLH